MLKRTTGPDYLLQYPKLNKWMNTCICCGTTGYKPDMPEVLTTRWGQGEHETEGAYNIRKYFRPLNVNEIGLCENCARLQNNNV